MLPETHPLSPAIEKEARSGFFFLRLNTEDRIGPVGFGSNRQLFLGMMKPPLMVSPGLYRIRTRSSLRPSLLARGGSATSPARTNPLCYTR